MATLDDVPSVREALSELTFPAEKWEVTACAEIRGVDVETRRKLYELPCRTFRNEADLADAL